MVYQMKNAITAPRFGQLLLDVLISSCALILAYILRFEGQVPPEYILQGLGLLPVVISVRLFWRFVSGLHRSLWRYTSVRDVLGVAFAVTLGSLTLVLIVAAFYQQRLPWGVLAHDWWLNLVGYAGVRLWSRLGEDGRMHGSPAIEQKRVLLVGAGQAGNLVAKEIRQHSINMAVVGFVDDDPQKLHSLIQGAEVLGRTQDIPRIAEQYHIDEILLCFPSATPLELRRVVDICHEHKLKVKTIPGFRELLRAPVSVARFREIQIEDLLNRDPVTLDRESAGAYIAGRVVMVTGAGGSIGSELCRQIVSLAPSRLILVGRGEFSVYSIEMELRESFPALELVTMIADVRDFNRMKRIFAQHTPDVIFHAAAHKHVPLMEKNPSEAIINNIFGTRIVAELADQFSAETFVLISSDKAVNPTNVMGASKRVAELVVQELATRSKTRFMSVRFGNVLGSRGSVIPLFKRQIEAGGPITITHPEIIRYFMTIPEAAQLVLQAGALGKGGEVFVLDMGDPVKIVDLARDLIRLSGLEPDVDIKFKFTGLRPGEKLFEELLTAEEGTSSTSYRKIHTARPEPILRERLELGLTLLQAAAMEGDDLAIRRGLKALVKTYKLPKADEDALEQWIGSTSPVDESGQSPNPSA